MASQDHSPIEAFAPDAAAATQRVSDRSLLSDREWILPGPRPMVISFEPRAALRVERARAYARLMSTAKVVLLAAYRLGWKPATLVHATHVFRRFALFLVRLSPPTTTFADVRPSLVADYLALATKAARRRPGHETLVRHLLVLRLLHRHRDLLEDRITFEPAVPGLCSGWPRRQANGLPATKCIPEGALRDYLRVALDVVDKAEAVLENLREQARWTPVEGREPPRFLPGRFEGRKGPRPADVAAGCARVRTALDRFERGGLRRLPTGARLTGGNLGIEADVPTAFIHGPGREKLLARFRKLKGATGPMSRGGYGPCVAGVADLQIACFIIIATSTGMRAGEIAAMEPRCLREVPRSTGTPVYWIDSRLFKTSPQAQGEPSSWICGPLAARAVRVLERLVDILPTTCKTRLRGLPLPNTLFRSYLRQGGGIAARPIVTVVLNKHLRLFAKKHGLPEVTPHQFRRSFARYIVRYTSVPIDALREHFKHVSICMTDWYLGFDVEIFEDLSLEREEVSFEVLDRALLGKVGGPGGKRLGEAVREKVAAGLLPRSFLGRAGDEYRHSVIRELHENGFYANPCTEFSYCVFIRDHSPCGGSEAPVPNRCHPATCPSSYIDMTNVPFFRRRIAYTEEQLGRLADEGEANGPLAVFLQRQLDQDRRAIAPLLTP